MGGLYVNARNNPLLLLIDMALGDWFKTKQSGGDIETLKQALDKISLACEGYLKEKRAAAAAPKGHESARMPEVIKLQAAAVGLFNQLNDA